MKSFDTLAYSKMLKVKCNAIGWKKAISKLKRASIASTVLQGTAFVVKYPMFYFQWQIFLVFCT